MCERFHNIRHSLLVIVFTMQEFPDRTIVLTVEQTCYGWLSVGGGVCEGGVWCRVVRGVCCWGCGVCEGRYPSDALWVKKCFWSPVGIFFVVLHCRYTLKHAS